MYPIQIFIFQRYCLRSKAVLLCSAELCNDIFFPKIDTDTWLCSQIGNQTAKKNHHTDSRSK